MHFCLSLLVSLHLFFSLPCPYLFVLSTSHLTLLNINCINLSRFPWLGVEKAEIITALCSMLHGPLSKVDSEAFGSVKEIIDGIAANLVFMQYADSIAQLFLDRFRYFTFLCLSVRTCMLLCRLVVYYNCEEMLITYTSTSRVTLILFLFISPHDITLLIHPLIHPFLNHFLTYSLSVMT